MDEKLPKTTLKDRRDPPYLSKRLRAVFDLLRPFTLIPPLMAGIFITMVPVVLKGDAVLTHWNTLIYVGVTLSLLQGAGQSINQSYEEEVRIDILNKKDYRPIPRGDLTISEGLGIGMFLIMVGVTRALTVNNLFGIFAILIAFFSFFYTYPPVRAKKRPIVNILWLGISRGLLPVMAGFSVFNDPLCLTSLAWGSIAFVWVVAFNPAKDLPDIWGDREFDIPSIPVIAGKEGLKIYTTAFALVTIGVIHLMLQFLPSPFSWLWVLLPLILAIPLSLILDLRLNRMENNLSWVLFYLGLGMVFLIPPIAMILS